MTPRWLWATTWMRERLRGSEEGFIIPVPPEELPLALRLQFRRRVLRVANRFHIQVQSMFMSPFLFALLTVGTFFRHAQILCAFIGTLCMGCRIIIRKCKLSCFQPASPAFRRAKKVLKLITHAKPIFRAKLSYYTIAVKRQLLDSGPRWSFPIVQTASARRLGSGNYFPIRLKHGSVRTSYLLVTA